MLRIYNRIYQTHTLAGVASYGFAIFSSVTFFTEKLVGISGDVK